MAWTYLTRIFVSSSTCWSVRLRRTRASRSVLPISNTVDGLLLGRSGPVARLICLRRVRLLDSTVGRRATGPERPRRRPSTVFEIGNTLREARVRRTLTLQQVEEDTKIRVKYVQAMENEDFDLMPGATYVKGFLRTYSE